MSAAVTILLTGALVGASCALLGSFLVLRRMALLGDAISHAVLPGIVVAFLVTNSLATLPLLVGASLVGLLTVLLVETLSRSRRLSEDTSIGVVFPALFSLGVILVTAFAGEVHIDIDCVLYGEIAFSHQDELRAGSVSLGPRSLWVTGASLLFNLGFVLLFYKELKVTSFDPDLSGSIGFSPALVHYLLMTAVSLTVVAAFESVGSILVVAMLIVPPATAYLLTNRLGVLLLLAVVIAVASSTAGFGLAVLLDCSIAGAMATCAGGFFVAAFLGSPRRGLLAQAYARRVLQGRLVAHLLLLHVKGRAEVGEGSALMVDEMARRFRWSHRRVERAVAGLRRQGLLELVAGTDGALRLTPAGEAALEQAGTAALAHPH